MEKEQWYRRQFGFPENWRGKTIRLVFEGVDYSCDVWLNGTHLGRHEGMFSICHFITFAPDMKWGIVDYFQQRKRSYDYVKRACQPLLVSLKCSKRRWLPGETFKAELWIVNDLHAQFEDCMLRVEVTDDCGNGLVSETYAVREVAPDSSASYETFEWKVQGELGGRFRVAARLRRADGQILSANQQVLLLADHEQVRKECQQRAEQLREVKARFPTADYYRFFPELSGPERARRFGDLPLKKNRERD